ncbi:hypothetical protein [Rhizobium sp. BK176]|uniref:hypothetical protein n=1 Tax=Rhizobium sp. BK176 TaxID=2587071 RepID=UPI00216A9451|nr:hypothetical protein [Rhizobium sp. BK176]MCS4089466.1 hypothetical protein [Rhizobium sp. BK176]
MQMQTYFYDDSKALDWEPSTSFKVIDAIRASNRGFFDEWDTSGHPGMKAARLARAPDAKMTTSDIRAWDDLVVKELIPSVDREIDGLKSEAERLGVDGSPIYEHAVGLQNERKAWIARSHERFMEAYRPHL